MARLHVQTRRSPKRRTLWDLGPGSSSSDLSVQSVTSSSSVIVGTGAEAQEPLTVVRLRGMVNLQLSAATAALDGFSVFLGIGIASADAFGAGVTALPKPFDDIDWSGWLWHFGTSIKVPAAGAVGTTIDQLDIPIDSKAMRKMNINETLFLLAQFTEVGTATVQIGGYTRVLAKL